MYCFSPHGFSPSFRPPTNKMFVPDPTFTHTHNHTDVKKQRMRRVQNSCRFNSTSFTYFRAILQHFHLLPIPHIPTLSLDYNVFYWLLEGNSAAGHAECVILQLLQFYMQKELLLRLMRLHFYQQTKLCKRSYATS